MLLVLVLTLLFQPAIARQTEIPQGTVTQHVFDQSEIFPGTVRDYWVYVPQQYDGSTPASVYVGQDGIKFNAPAAFDSLIAAGEMPVTIGVFVMHGRVPAPNDNAQDRYNRSFEYDALSDRYARFLLEELLPHIEREHGLNLSHDGKDRAIGGSSTGAIAAFTAAWQRPDAFSRVFSSIGTYVDFRGGNDYPSMIRKYEPRPIRVFLEDGSNDLNSYAGDWWMVNQEMERALTFAGYEVAHAWGEGGHDSKFATAIFSDAMRFLWKDWETPVKAGPGSQMLQKILIPGEDWEVVSEGHVFTEGPAVNAKGEVFFNDVVRNKSYKIALDGTVSELPDDVNGRDGQRFGPDGRRYMVAGGDNQIVAFDEAGNKTVIAEGFRGNDLVVRHDGGIYVTQPNWDGTDTSHIWYISPKGEARIVDSGLLFANGVTLSPDQTLLYVADSYTHWLYSYQVQEDGSLAYKQRYFYVQTPATADNSGADGIRTDREGLTYIATRVGIQVADPIGRVRAVIPTPNGASANLTFGGENFDVVYVMSRDKVYRRKLKVQGALNYQAPVKPPRPGL